MKFPIQIAQKNIKRKPFRSAAMSGIAMVLSFTLFFGAYMIVSLREGLSSYQDRLGADIVVVPVSATSHGALDDILLQGITGNYYMNGQTVDKIYAVKGIESITKQFYLASAKASCCASRVQIIGFDPETDFSVLPWISENYKGEIEDGDIVVGCNINVPADREILFYGKYYHVAAQLAKTGTGLDSAVYTNMNTIKGMAEDAKTLLDSDPFQGISLKTAASAILIKVADGYSISDVTDDINIHISKVQATSAKNMISNISEGLNGVSKIITGLVILVWLLAVVILVISFMMVSNERKKEFAVLRIMGASQKMLFQILSSETVLLSVAGALAGLILAVTLILPFSSYIRDALGLPFLTPDFSVMSVLFVLALVISVLTGYLTAYLFSRRITKSEAGLLLREDA